MAFNNYLEDENDKPYFTTNSLAYYYDKMEGFAKAVDGSAKALNLTKEEVEKRLTLYIEQNKNELDQLHAQNKNELDQRLEQWDGKLETFDSSVETLLTEWVDDGTLNSIIDSTLINQKIAPITAQLTETKLKIKSKERFLRYGKVEYPSDIPLEMPFAAYKTGLYQYKHNATPNNQFNWTGATEIFLRVPTSGGSDLDGTSRDNPIAWSQFTARFKQGVYGSQTKFIITFLDDFYNANDIGTTYKINSIPANLLFRSEKKTTWIGRDIKQGDSTMPTGWELVSGNTYKCSLSSAINVVPSDYSNLDIYGVPHPLIYKNSQAEVQSTEGSYSLVGTEVYAHLHKNGKIEGVRLNRNDMCFDATGIGDYVIMLENIGFTVGGNLFSGTSVNSKFYLFNCKFNRALDHNFSINGIYTAFLFDCIGSHASRDGFNYHATSPNSIAVEVNCKAYGSGQYKLPGGNANMQSNNGSTAHDNMNVIRIGGVYWLCEGPVVADVSNCYSLNIGCQSYDLLNTLDSPIRTGFYFFNESGTTPENEKPKYLIECLQSGKYFTYGIYSIRSTKTYYMNFVGSDTVYASFPPVEVYYEELVE